MCWGSHRCATAFFKHLHFYISCVPKLPVPQVLFRKSNKSSHFSSSHINYSKLYFFWSEIIDQVQSISHTDQPLSSWFINVEKQHVHSAMFIYLYLILNKILKMILVVCMCWPVVLHMSRNGWENIIPVTVSVLWTLVPKMPCRDSFHDEGGKEKLFFLSHLNDIILK